MVFLLVIVMGSSLLHCSTDDFSKVNETRIKLVTSYPSGHVEVRCLRGKKTYQRFKKRHCFDAVAKAIYK